MSTTWRGSRPGEGEFNPYYSRYIDRVPEGDVVDTLERQIAGTTGLLRSLPADKHDHRYAAGKWSIKEVIGHIIDGERVFSYRALRFARGDTTPLPGFDENEYAANANSAARTLEDLTSELEHLRLSTVRFFGGLDEPAFSRHGLANDNPISVRALAFIIAGHETHHLDLIRTRYL
jgi:uncharacterized damage-inducible protein DinB